MTELIFILDRSGSMSGLERDTIGGFNAMIEKQRSEPEKTLVSTVLFSGRSAVLHDRLPLEQIPKMTDRDYCVGGSTALLDAIGETIHHIGVVHKYARAEDRPEKTLVVITTDGMENASRKYTYEQIREMIGQKKEKYGWEFLFLGANIDAAAEARRFCINEDFAANYCCDSAGTQLNFDVVGEAVCRVRKGAKLDKNWKSRIDEDYRKRGK